MILSDTAISRATTRYSDNYEMVILVILNLAVHIEVIFTLCPPLCAFLFRVKAVKPESDGSDTEVTVQYHLQKQDCQLLAASETGDTENRLFDMSDSHLTRLILLLF